MFMVLWKNLAPEELINGDDQNHMCIKGTGK